MGALRSELKVSKNIFRGRVLHGKRAGKLPGNSDDLKVGIDGCVDVRDQAAEPRGSVTPNHPVALIHTHQCESAGSYWTRHALHVRSWSAASSSSFLQ